MSKLTLSRLLAACLMVGLTGAVATAQQEVRSAIGVRLGSPYSLSYKQAISDEGMVELLLGARPYFGFRYSYFSVGGAYLHHLPLEVELADGPVNAYFGAGATAQFWRYRDGFFGPERLRSDFGDLGIRVGPYVGAQWTPGGSDVEITLDWAPSLLVGRLPVSSLRWGYYTLGVRYVLSRR